jgi:peptide/nickel transport system permease protein
VKARRVGRSARIGAAILLALAVIALVLPLTGRFDPEAINPDKVLAGPELDHPLGFDSAGRDVFSRLLVAYRSSLVVAVASVLLAMLVGGAIGVIAGYYRGAADMLLMRPIDMMLAFPALLLAVTLIAILGRGSVVVVLAIAGIYIPVFVRVLRSSVLSVVSLTYVDAARCRGQTDAATILRHVLPNAVGPALVLASILAGVAIQIEAALSFLGLGAQPPTPSLGVMLAEGRDFLAQAPLVEIFPGLVIIVTVVSFLLIGDGLRARLDPRGIAA